MFIYSEREREKEREREREREGLSGEWAERGDKESQAGSAAVSTEPDVGLELTNCEIMT